MPVRDQTLNDKKSILKKHPKSYGIPGGVGWNGGELVCWVSGGGEVGPGMGSAERERGRMAISASWLGSEAWTRERTAI